LEVTIITTVGKMFFFSFYFIFKNRRAIEYDWFKIWKKKFKNVKFKIW